VFLLFHEKPSIFLVIRDAPNTVFAGYLAGLIQERAGYPVRPDIGYPVRPDPGCPDGYLA
jgi:hypothetical protein